MSIRYGISLTLEPSFTAGLHRARQVICSQYGRWAAEMHAVHVPLTGYLPCREPVVPYIEAGLEEAAAAFRGRNPDTFVSRRGIMAEAGNRGNIYVDFGDAGGGPPGPGGGGILGRGGPGSGPGRQSIDQLRSQVAATLVQHNLGTLTEGDCLRFALLQCADMPAPVFDSAVRFAEGIIDGVGLAVNGRVFELALFRYESAGAGDDWDGGGWTADLRWQVVNCFPLSDSQGR